MRLIDADAMKENIKKSDLNNQEKIALLLCVSSMQTIVPPPNPPLTLEELREMDGEPVYLDFIESGEWALVRLMHGDVFFVHKNRICAPAKVAFKCGGKICRRKPEEPGNES